MDMTGELLEKLQPREQTRQLLAKGVRRDGRAPTEVRPLALEDEAPTPQRVPTCLRCGNSCALVGVHKEVTEISAKAENRGRITVRVDLPTISGADFVDDAVEGSIFSCNSGQIAAAAGETLTRIFNESGVLDLEALVIEKGMYAWHLVVEVLFVEYDGGFLDLPCKGITAALKNVSLPPVVWDGDQKWFRECAEDADGDVIPSRRPRLKTSVSCLTLCHLLGECWVADPTAAEEAMGSTVFMFRAGQATEPSVEFSRFGGSPVELRSLLPLASQVWDG